METTVHLTYTDSDDDRLVVSSLDVGPTGEPEPVVSIEIFGSNGQVYVAPEAVDSVIGALRAARDAVSGC